MATYKDVISTVKTALNRGIGSSDDRLSARYIISVALRKRQRVLKQEQEKTVQIRSPLIIQAKLHVIHNIRIHHSSSNPCDYVQGSSANSGHYYVFARLSYEEQIKTWICLNDTTVTYL